MARKRSKGEKSARAKKFLNATNENVIVNPLHCYRLIELSSYSQLYQTFLFVEVESRILNL